MITKKYTLCMNYEEENISKIIDKFINRLHQGNQTTNEFEVIVTVKKYSEKDKFDKILESMENLLIQYKSSVISLNEFREGKKEIRKMFNEN